MKERLEGKIEEILNYIIGKDVSEITPVEYGMLDAKLKDLQMKESQKENNKRLVETMANMIASPFVS